MAPRQTHKNTLQSIFTLIFSTKGVRIIGSSCCAQELGLRIRMESPSFSKATLRRPECVRGGAGGGESAWGGGEYTGWGANARGGVGTPHPRGSVSTAVGGASGSLASLCRGAQRAGRGLQPAPGGAEGLPSFPRGLGWLPFVPLPPPPPRVRDRASSFLGTCSSLWAPGRSL